MKIFNKQHQLKSYIKLLRIKDWRAFFFISLFGFVVAQGYTFPSTKIINFWLAFFLFLGFGFSINDCFDTKEDMFHSDPKKLIVSKEISFKKSLFFSILLAIFGLLLTYKFGVLPFFLALGAVLLVLFYSAPPFRFKSRPFLDLVSHGLYAGSFIFFFPISIFSKELKPIYYLIAFSMFWVSVMLEMRNHLEDYQFDKKAKLKTTVCFLGPTLSEKISKFLIFIFPLTLFPVFFFLPLIYLFLFFVLTLIFLPIFLAFSFKTKLLLFENKNYQKPKSLKVTDLYTILAFILIAVALITY